jgi:enediyne core biosynthesis thioesterase
MLTEIKSPKPALYDFSTVLEPSLLVLEPVPEREVLTFRHSIDIYLKDSNAYGNTYFARYFEWQGVCRERWLQQCISADLLQPIGVLVTKNATIDYVRETFPFQTIECELNTEHVKNCSLKLLFRFSVAGNLVCVGSQHIVFMTHDKRIQRLPQHILEKVRKFEHSQEKTAEFLTH